jgi:hypothetical protein
MSTVQFPQHACHAGFVLALGWAATVRQLSLIRRSTVAASAQRGIRSGNLTMNPSRFGIFTLGSVSAFITSLRIGNSKHLFPHARLYPRPGMRSADRKFKTPFSTMRDSIPGPACGQSHGCLVKISPRAMPCEL